MFRARGMHLVSVGVLLMSSAGCGRHGSTQATRKAPRTVLTATARTRTVPATFELSGALSAEEQSELTPRVAGRVAAVMVETGDRVQAGAPLIRLENVDYRLASSAAETAVAQARARLGLPEGEADASEGPFDPDQAAEVRAADANRRLAEDALRRLEPLAESGAASAADLEAARQRAAAAREQFEAARNGVRAAWMQLRSARVALSQAQKSVADAIVRAPFEGEVAARHVSVGEYAAPQKALLTLVRTDPLRLELSVPQESVNMIARGQRVEVRVDTHPGEVFAGAVRYIGAALEPSSRALRVEATVPNEKGALRPGMFVMARVLVGGTRARIEIPTRAVVTELGTSRVFVVRAGHAEERVVTPAGEAGGATLLSSGVKAGEQVAVTELSELSDGDRVVAKPSR